MINYNSSGGSMKAFNSEEVSKAIRMTLASVSMEEDFCLKENDYQEKQSISVNKVLNLQKGGLKTVRSNTKTS